MRTRALSALIAVGLVAVPLSARAVEPPSADGPSAAGQYIRLVRVIEAEDAGLNGIAGVAYAAEVDSLLVTGVGGGNRPVVKQLSRLGEHRSVSPLPATFMGVAAAYDEARDTLVGADVRGRLIEAGGFLAGESIPLSGPHERGLGRATGLALASDGSMLVLDAEGRRIVELDSAASSIVAETPLTGTDVDLAGLAVAPDGTFLSIDASGATMYAFDPTGRLLSTRDIREAGLVEPLGAVLAPSADPTDDPEKLNLYVADGGGEDPAQASVSEFELTATPLSAAALTVSNETATLVQTISGSDLDPDSPDPSGMTYNAQVDRLVMTDGEIEEERVNSYPYPGKNGWLFTRISPVQTTQTFDTTTHTCQANAKTVRNVEPVGIAWSSASGTYYVVRDGENVLWELNDSFSPVRCLALNPYGIADAEGIAYGLGSLWIADGTAGEIWRLLPGPDGVFGTSTGGGSHDESATHFDTSAHGQPDPEGVEYDAANGTLYVVSNKNGSTILEMTTTGEPLRALTVSGVTLDSARGLTLAPGTTEAAQHIYVADARVDNNDNAGAVDGHIYELAAGMSEAAPSAPETTITDGPSGTVTETSATFTFSGSADATSFECRLDGAAFSACTSPQSYSGLAEGTHTFEVRALAGSTADPTPASRTWTISGASSSPTGENLLRNPSFELDANGDTIPDDWGTNSRFTRSDAIGALDASFVGRHVNNNAIIRQQVGVTPGTKYHFSGMVNLPATHDAFSFQLNVQWREGGSNLGSPIVLGNFTDDTAGAWVAVDGVLTAPSGATSARVQMDGNSMNATGTAYVDAFFFGTGSSPPPPLDTTITSAPPSSTTSTSAVFEFTGTSAASFECQLDGSGWAACTSPHEYIGLALGDHTFEVRGVDEAGQRDDTPAAYRWTVSDTAATTNLLSNPSFELDANGDTIPDSWGTKNKFTRSSAVTPQEGAFAGRHFANNDSGYNVFQEVPVSAGARYDFSGWVNIPTTSDAFTFKLRIRWMNGTTAVTAFTAESFTAPTTGWQQATASLTAPSGATSARVMMVASSLNATIYVDDFSFMAVP